MYDVYIEEYGSKVFKLTTNKQTKIRQAIQCLCHNIVYHLAFGGNVVEVVLNSNAYNQPLIYNATKINRKVSYTYTRSIIDWLVHSGRATLTKGGIEDWHLAEDGSFSPKTVTCSSLEVGEWIMELFQEVVAKRRIPTMPSVLEVRDRHGEVITKRLGQYEKEVVILLNQYNQLARNTTIEVGDTFCDVQIKKVYNNSSFEQGGRNYIIGTPTFTKEERRTIKINGEETVELDFKALHPRIAATLNGVVLDSSFDPYQIEIEGCHPKLARYMGKFATLILINTGIQFTKEGKVSVNSARKALISALRKRKEVDFSKMCVKLAGTEYKLPEYVDYTEILTSCVLRNDYMRNWFLEPDGLRLQNLDSKIMDLILGKFNERGEIVLCIHDSIVVSAKYKKEAVEIMQGCFRQVLGNDINCVIK